MNDNANPDKIQVAIVYYPMGETLLNGVKTDNYEVARTMLNSIDARSKVIMPRPSRSFTDEPEPDDDKWELKLYARWIMDEHTTKLLTDAVADLRELKEALQKIVQKLLESEELAAQHMKRMREAQLETERSKSRRRPRKSK